MKEKQNQKKIVTLSIDDYVKLGCHSSDSGNNDDATMLK